MSRDDYLHQQAWNYFALHAQQRLTTVNFYLVLATALTAAAVASFGENFQFSGMRLAAGLLLSLLSFAFWGSPQTGVGRLRRDRRVGEGCWQRGWPRN